MRARTLLLAALVGALLLGGAAAAGAATIAETPEESNATVPDEGDVVDNTTHDIDAGDNVSEADRPHHAGSHSGHHGQASESADRHGGNDSHHGGDRSGGADRPGAVGPSDGLPAQVPDHVTEIHNTIESFLNGEIDNLGDAISDIVSDADDASADEDADADANEGDQKESSDNEESVDDETADNEANEDY